MLNIIKWFFLILGFIFFLIIISASYIYVTDKYGVRTFITHIRTPVASTDSKNTNLDKNPLLNQSQEKMLENIGVDPAKLPSKITPEMLVCFNEKLGSARTLEIKNGSSPTPSDFVKAQSCF